MLGEKTVLAIDPGSSKCGAALVRRDDLGELSLLWHGIIPATEIAAKATALHEEYNYGLVVVGSGTKSKTVIESLRELMPSIGILVVDEKDTTMQARERYWEMNPRRGLRKFIPATMQVPPDPVDDYVALILAERVLLAN
ncbi:resolvase [Kamptonema cortianum]|nr:resolvase [Geitlerinema splendidum]MDK3156997.1 resolvase [Kamptonema cortianum]